MFFKARNKRSQHYASFSHRALMIFALIPIILMIIVCNDIYYEIIAINKDYESNIQEFQYRKLQIIDYIIDERKNQMQVQNRYVSQFLTYTLANDYKGNYNQLEIDLTSRNKNTSAFIAYSNALKEDIELLKESSEVAYSGETLFICDKNGIIIDSKYSNNSTRAWKLVTDSKSNTELTKNTIDGILDRRKTLLFWETHDTFNPEDKIYNSNVIFPDIDTVNDIVLTSGLTELSNYDILVPEYIDFDESTLKFIDSVDFPRIGHRIVLVREVNLYSVLQPYLADIQNYDFVISKYTENCNKAISTKIVTCVVISGFLICSFLFCLLVISGFGNKKTTTDRRGDNNDN